MADITIPSQVNQVMPSGEIGSIPQLGRLQDTSAFKDVRQLNAYSFMSHTYNGSHGYRDCSYLIPHAREMFYEDRRKYSYYVNVFKPILNAMVDECFSKDAKRETNNELFQGFIDNCDAAGTSIGTFMQVCIKNARLYSINFIVMENFPADDIQTAETAQDAINSRKYPYIYEKQPQEVDSVETNQQGAMTSICFCDGKQKIDGKEYETYRRWDAETWVLFYRKKTRDGEIEIELDSGFHGLGMIPVVAIVDFARTASLKTMPDPDLYDIAFLCFGLFNKESQVCTMEQMQTFSILCTSGMGSSAKAIGPATFLDCGTETKWPPQYVAPSQEGIKTLVDNCERLKTEIKDQAKQNGVIGVKDAQSGIAKEWDFRAEEAVLRKTSIACERVEMLLAEIFGLYVNQQISYVVEYPKDFSPLADADRINSGLLILKEAPPPAIETAVWSDIANIRWRSDEELKKAIKDAFIQDIAERDAIRKAQNAEPIEPMEDDTEDEDSMQQGQEKE